MLSRVEVEVKQAWCLLDKPFYSKYSEMSEQ